MLKMKTLALGAYQTNCYLVWDESADTCVVIDPGYQPETVLAEVKRLGKEIAAILLTHGHFDHVGAVRDLAAETGCPVYLHEADLSMPPQMTAGPLYYTNTYDEGNFVELAGLSFKVLHTPGHTPGSVCYEAGEHLFTGDTMFEHGYGRTDLPGGDFSAIVQSLKRLMPLQQDHQIYPGHGS